jgi:hypothetical protein
MGGIGEGEDDGGSGGSSRNGSLIIGPMPPSLLGMIDPQPGE